MRRTVITLLITTLTWLAYPVTLNDYGQFIQDDNNRNVKSFFEEEQYMNNDDVIYSSDDKLYLNGRIIAELNDFFSILTDMNKIYVATRKTIFSLNGEELKPILTFNDMIYDFTSVNGEFHISLMNTIMNGFKFTHVKVTGNNDISTVETQILDLKKENLPKDDTKNPLVFRSTGQNLVKGSN